MTISSISSVYSAPKTLSTGLSNQSNASSNISPSSASVSSNSDGAVASRSLDFTNISPREFNDLFKSGGFGDNLPPLVLPKNGMEAHNRNPNEILDQKFNYIDDARKIIAFNKGIGAPTEFHEKLLNKMLALQGKSSQEQPTVNSYA